MTVKTIKPSGGDYTSLTAWESAQLATLVAPAEAECYDFALSDNLAISGITTSAANYIRIYTPPAERHDGRSRAVSGHGFRIQDTTSSGTVRVAANHVRFEGLEIEQTGTGVNPAALQLNSFASGSDIRVEKCIVHNAISSTDYTITAASANLNLIWRNNITYGACRSWDTRGAASVLCENSTFWRSTAQLGLVSDTETVCKNTYSGHAGAASDDFWSGGAPSGNNCASSDTSALTRFPTGSVNSVAGSAVFASVTTGSEDFTEKAGTNALVDAGATLGTVTDDIIGTARPQGSFYDISAFERISAGGGTSGTLAVTEGADTLAAAGGVLVAGTLSRTEGSDTIAASGGVLVSGTLAVTEGVDTLAASGTVGNVTTGTLAVSEGSDTVSAAGGVLVSGSLAVTEGSDTLVGSGSVLVAGTLAVIEDADTCAANGAVFDASVTGTMAATEAPDTLQAYDTLASGAGDYPAKKRKYVIRKDGKLLVFTDPALAKRVLHMDDEPEPVKQQPAKKQKKAAPKQIEVSAPPDEVVDLAEIKALAEKHHAEQEYSRLLAHQQYETLLSLLERLQEDEEDDWLLMAAA